MKSLSLISFLLIICFGISCKSTSINPVSPEVKVGTYSPPKQETSFIHIPIEMEMKSYFKAADEAVPYEFKGKEQNCEGVSYDYKFIRDPIKIEGKSGRNRAIEIGIAIEGKYALNLNYCSKCTDLFSSSKSCLTPRIYASCGVDEPMRKIKVEYHTEVDVKPNFQLESKTSLQSVIPKDKCEITVFKYDATDRLVKEVTAALTDLTEEIDQEIESLEIRKEVELIWKSFTQPFPIQNYGFFYIYPEKISVNNLNLQGTKLTFSVAVEAYPKVTFVKDSLPEKELPDLSKIKKEEGFNVHLDLIADYDSLSAIINRELSGKTLKIKKRSIILQKAKIYGASNKQLSIEVEFTGSKKGKMFFLGTPAFNDSLQEISFPDLSFELETKHILLKSAKWLFSKKITEMIRSYTTFNIKTLLDETSKKIEKELNQKIDENIYLMGKINETKVKTIFPDSKNLIIQTKLNGNLKVQIK